MEIRIRRSLFLQQLLLRRREPEMTPRMEPDVEVLFLAHEPVSGEACFSKKKVDDGWRYTKACLLYLVQLYWSWPG